MYRTTKSRKNPRERETNKYFVILEVNTIKQAQIREINHKRIPLEKEKTTRTQSIYQESNLRDNYFSCPSRKIRCTFLKVDERTPSNGPDNKKTNDDA